MKNSASPLTTVKVVTTTEQANRWKASAKKLGLSRNQFLLALIKGGQTPVAT